MNFAADFTRVKILEGAIFTYFSFAFENSNIFATQRTFICMAKEG